MKRTRLGMTLAIGCCMAWPAAAQAQVTIQISDDPDPVLAGQGVTFNAAIANNTGQALTSTSFDPRPIDTSVWEQTADFANTSKGTCDVVQQRCDFGTIADGETVFMSMVIRAGARTPGDNVIGTTRWSLAADQYLTSDAEPFQVVQTSIVSPTGGGGGGGGGGDLPGNPTVSGVNLAGNATSGFLVGLTLSETAQNLKIDLQRRVKGRKVNGKCKPRARNGKKCKTWKKVATALSTPGQPGTSVFPISAAKTKNLKKGKYRFKIQMRDLGGNRSKPVYTSTFTVRKR